MAGVGVEIGALQGAGGAVLEYVSRNPYKAQHVGLCAGKNSTSSVLLHLPNVYT